MKTLVQGNGPIYTVSMKARSTFSIYWLRLFLTVDMLA